MFSQRVKEATGDWIYGRFRWHCFSFGYEDAYNGAEALDAYLSQWVAPFFVFDEDSTWLYKCHADKYPDFTPLGADIYVAHQNMKWTMAFTHEQPDIGSFFRREVCKVNVQLGLEVRIRPFLVNVRHRH